MATNINELQNTVKKQEKLILELKQAIRILQQQLRVVDKKATRATEKARVNTNEINKITRTLKAIRE